MPAPEASAPAGAVLPLELANVCFGAGGTHILEDVSFRLAAGGISALLGPNGAGKSLLLRLATGLLRPTRGVLAWRGPGAAQAREAHALVLQRPVLLRRSVAANVVYPLALRGLSRAERAARCADVLAALRLTSFAERPARLLSVGEQQRVALARAWATRPQVLFLDEPAAALDPGSASALEAAIAEIAAAGAKVVLATHDLAQARRLAQDVLFLHRGRLLEHTPAAEFFERPHSGPARRFVAGELVE